MPRAGQDDQARRSRRNMTAIAAVAAATLGVLLLQSLLHGHLSGHDEYDDGVYFGSSLQLIHGIMPYRDFVLIQPPMISVILLPFAALSFLTGPAHAFETARIFIDLAATANVVLAGLLVRHRPTAQVVVSTGFMAVYPATIGSAQTVLLEPPLVLFCLAGLLCLFDGDRITTSRRRLLACGVLFGVAGAIKLWAALPLLAAICVAGRSGPAARRTLAGGAAAGFGGCTLPFIIGSPGGFFGQVFVTQALRNGGGYPAAERLADLTGLPGLYTFVSTHAAGGPHVLAVVTVILAALCSAALCLAAFTGRGRTPASPLDLFALLATALAVAALLGSPTYFYHYAGFAAPFIALLYGTVAVRLRDRFRARRAVALAATAVPLILICAMLGRSLNAIVTAGPATQVDGAFASEILGHGCVLSLDTSLTVLDNRFTGDVRGCPRVVDWLGQERVLDHGLAQTPSDAANAAVQAAFMRWVKASDTVIVPHTNPGWDPAIVRYMSSNFRLEAQRARGFYVYVRSPAPRP
jgi:alpha-1,2-mannosyltransferase